MLKGDNPMQGIIIGKKVMRQATPYSADQVAAILTRALDQPPEVKFPLLTFSGARSGEVIDANTADIEQVFGVWCLRIREDDREPGQWIKGGNEGYSNRDDVPLHPAIISQGARQGGEGPLFPTYGKCSDNRRVTKAGKALRKWIHGLGVVDNPKIKPLHSFRSYVRSWWENNSVVQPKTRNMITGHMTEGEVARYIKVEIETMLRAIELLPNPLLTEPDKVPEAE